MPIKTFYKAQDVGRAMGMSDRDSRRVAAYVRKFYPKNVPGVNLGKDSGFKFARCLDESGRSLFAARVVDLKMRGSLKEAVRALKIQKTRRGVIHVRCRNARKRIFFYRLLTLLSTNTVGGYSLILGIARPNLALPLWYRQVARMLYPHRTLKAHLSRVVLLPFVHGCFTRSTSSDYTTFCGLLR